MSGGRFSFGSFSLDAQRKLLFKDDVPVTLGQRGLALLEALLRAGGKTVLKTDLMDIAWPSQQVEESNLSVQIAGLRKCLGPGPDGSDWIATVARQGYRFIGPCRNDGAPAPQDPARSKAVEGDKPSIAVLPFDNSDDSPSGLLFSDGVSENIVNGLSRFSSLLVIAQHSSFRFRGATDLGETAKQLGVRYLVTGSLRRGDDRLRVSAQLRGMEATGGPWPVLASGVCRRLPRPTGADRGGPGRRRRGPAPQAGFQSAGRVHRL